MFVFSNCFASICINTNLISSSDTYRLSIAFLIVMAHLVKAQGFTGNVDKVAVLYGQAAPAGLDAVDPDTAL